MATEILFWVLKSALWALVFGFLSVVIKGRKNRKRAVGFFHPYTNDGGGGERVLWCAVKAIQEENPNLDCIFYAGDHDASPESLSGRAVDRFGVELLQPPQTYASLINSCTSSYFCFLLSWHRVNLSSVATFGYPGVKSSITHSLVGFTGLWGLVHTLLWDLVRLLRGAIAGIHYMIDEHFGISVVEYMAAGATPIDAILKILMMPKTNRLEMAVAARRRAGIFSEQKFYEDFKAAISPILCPASN
ncbi:hypothetical protein HHK36_031540 [Tetracentron sinense]|uniref:ALG11 mannosyltransferase N-terminal domain-containing protein n=1 Tax=Tetracentron sinense TaxID=13715 RepID=A0A834YAD8_TETSI|nr:hypothetical protein HHK36_031540 [Tetracentron sinense]